MATETGIDTRSEGATVVITHRIRDGLHAEYDGWLNEIGPECRASTGHLDWQIIRPIAGLTSTYTVIIRFDTPEHLKHWMNSDVRKRLIERVRPLLAKDDVKGHRYFPPPGRELFSTSSFSRGALLGVG